MKVETTLWICSEYPHREKPGFLVNKVNYWYQDQLFGSGAWTSISGSTCFSLTLLSTEIEFKYQPEKKEIDIVEKLEQIEPKIQVQVPLPNN